MEADMSGLRSTNALMRMLSFETVADLPRLQDALEDASPRTVFRYLNRVPYRRSYNHNGRYYTLHDPSRYDRFGLYSYGDIYFSIDGSLRRTVQRLVYEAEAGATHQELQELLRVRVHNTLLDLLKRSEVNREPLESVYVYLHIDGTISEVQRQRRCERIEAAKGEREFDVSDTVAIRVLLVLIRHPGSRPGDVVRHLHGHSPPMFLHQIQAVFDRYGLGEKGGPLIF